MPRDEPTDSPDDPGDTKGRGHKVIDAFLFPTIVNRIDEEQHARGTNASFLVDGEKITRDAGSEIWIVERVASDAGNPDEEAPVGFYHNSQPKSYQSTPEDFPDEDLTKPYLHLFYADGSIAGNIAQRDAPSGVPVEIWAVQNTAQRETRTPDGQTPHQEQDTDNSIEHQSIDQQEPSIHINSEINELRQIFPDISRSNFYYLDNGNIGAEVSFVPSDCAVNEFEVLIEYVPQYPGVPPRIWVTDPEIDPESGIVAGFDEYGSAQAKYDAPFDWSSEYTGYDAAKMMQSWIKHYCAYLEDREAEGLDNYLSRVQDEVERLREGWRQE